MFKIMKNQALEYLNNLIQKCKQYFNYIPSYNCLTNPKSSFFPASREGWFNRDPSIRSSESINVFKLKLLSFIFPIENSIINIFDPEGFKSLTRLRLRFSQLNIAFDIIFKNALTNYVDIA